MDEFLTSGLKMIAYAEFFAIYVAMKLAERRDGAVNRI